MKYKKEVRARNVQASSPSASPSLSPRSNASSPSRRQNTENQTVNVKTEQQTVVNRLLSHSQAPTTTLAGVQVYQPPYQWETPVDYTNTNQYYNQMQNIPLSVNEANEAQSVQYVSYQENYNQYANVNMMDQNSQVYHDCMFANAEGIPPASARVEQEYYPNFSPAAPYLGNNASGLNRLTQL